MSPGNVPQGWAELASTLPAHQSNRPPARRDVASSWGSVRHLAGLLVTECRPCRWGHAGPDWSQSQAAVWLGAVWPAERRMRCRAMSLAGESHRPLFSRILQSLVDPNQRRHKLSASEMRQLYLVSAHTLKQCCICCHWFRPSALPGTAGRRVVDRCGRQAWLCGKSSTCALVSHAAVRAGTLW